MPADNTYQRGRGKLKEISIWNSKGTDFLSAEGERALASCSHIEVCVCACVFGVREFTVLSLGCLFHLKPHGHLLVVSTTKKRCDKHKHALSGFNSTYRHFL
jgi:hypothetical protein